MNIALLGAGALGSLIGGLLADSGQDVTLIDVNDAHLQAIRNRGLHLHFHGQDRVVRRLAVCRPEAATASPDLLIVLTKALHTGIALAGVQHILTDRTHVLSLQNGLGNVEQIAAFVPDERILVGVTTWPAEMVASGHVHSHGQGGIRLSMARGAAQPVATECAAVMNAAGLRCEVDPDIWAAIWQKVAFNVALNSICAASGCTVDQLDLVPEGRALALRVIDEVAAVAQAHGVAMKAAKPAAEVVYAITHHFGHKSSMLQDVLAGRRTEIGAINGAVVTAGQRVGVAAPCTEALLALVRLIEARGALGAAAAVPPQAAQGRR